VIPLAVSAAVVGSGETTVYRWWCVRAAAVSGGATALYLWSVSSGLLAVCSCMSVKQLNAV
jgi:hypothetical protein